MSIILLVSSLAVAPFCCRGDVQRVAGPRVADCILEAGRVGVIDQKKAERWYIDVTNFTNRETEKP